MEEGKWFFEIELKSLLSEEKFAELWNELPKKLEMFNEETIFTKRFRPSDVRLRRSDKRCELVCKEGDPTHVCRKELVIPLPSLKEWNAFDSLLESLNFKPDPPWIKHKREFVYPLSGFDYIVCLQNVENFGKMLEVEILTENNDSSIHIPNIESITRALGCNPIQPAQFLQQMDEYIAAHKKA
ncbi:MAG: hypothetical protein V1847_02400 [Candidatus Diapherotrites archaeon]